MASAAASGGWSDADALAALREDGPTGMTGGGAGDGKKGQDAAFAGGDGAPSSSASSATATATDGDSDDWRTLYRTIVGSLRASSSSIFRDLSLETFVLGFRALTAAHASSRDDLPGEAVSVSSRRDAALVDALLDAARWALAFDASRRASQDLATYLRVPLECVRYFASEASPLEPAHAVVVDPAAPVLHVVVRGTTTWHDALTDLVAHTEELASDDEYEEEEEEELEGKRSESASRPSERAHAGMLRAARALHRRHTPLLVELLSGECAGYRVHCVGFSLGAGTASLLAHLWRRRRRRQQGPNDDDKGEVGRLASAVECTALGCPPTVTPRLARRMGRGGRTPGRTLTLVHNHDMIPRMSVASLAELRAELESHAAQASGASPLARWVRETGALTATQRAAGQLLSLAAAAGAARAFGGGGGGGVAAAGAAAAAGGGSTGALGRFMRAGFAAGAGALADKFKELHASAMQEDLGEAQQKDKGGDVYSGGPGGGEPTAVLLACPGEVLFLRRMEEGSVGAGAAYELRRCPLDGKRPGRILLKRSMLRDHYLTHMVRALRSVKEGQLLA